MKKKDFIYIGILIVTVVFNIFLIVRGIIMERYYEKERSSLVRKDENNKKVFVRDLDLLSQEIGINYGLLYDEVRKRASARLIYAYSGDECNKCTFEDIALLKEKISKYKAKDVMILPVMEDTRNVNIMLQADLAGIDFKRLDKGFITFPCRRDGSSNRFFAILLPSGKIILPFFPDLNFPERANAYLDFVFEKYFNGSKNIEK
jgi:hypothetical protein